MATAPHGLMTLEEFRSRYAGEKPYYEYWFGEAVQKPVPTLLHALLVKILCFALDEAQYLSGPELELRIDPEWQPKADVAAWIGFDGPYPTEPIDVVVEVLSPDDRMHHVIAKCRQYERVGIRSIFVMDPDSQDAWNWNADRQNLERIEAMLLPNGRHIPIDSLWSELDRQVKKSRKASSPRE